MTEVVFRRSFLECTVLYSHTDSRGKEMKKKKNILKTKKRDKKRLHSHCTVMKLKMTFFVKLSTAQIFCIVVCTILYQKEKKMCKKKKETKKDFFVLF